MCAQKRRVLAHSPTAGCWLCRCVCHSRFGVRHFSWCAALAANGSEREDRLSHSVPAPSQSRLVSPPRRHWPIVSGPANVSAKDFLELDGSFSRRRRWVQATGCARRSGHPEPRRGNGRWQSAAAGRHGPYESPSSGRSASHVRTSSACSAVSVPSSSARLKHRLASGGTPVC